MTQFSRGKRINNETHSGAQTLESDSNIEYIVEQPTLPTIKHPIESAKAIRIEKERIIILVFW